MSSLHFIVLEITNNSVDSVKVNVAFVVVVAVVVVIVVVLFAFHHFRIQK
jgi:hypothetical protein